MSRSRKVSAITSLPKPAALVPDGIGRSMAAVVALGQIDRRGCVCGRLTCGHVFGRSRMAGRPSRSGALTQPGQDLATGIAVGGRNANFSLIVAQGVLGIATDPTACAAEGGRNPSGNAITGSSLTCTYLFRTL